MKSFITKFLKSINSKKKQRYELSQHQELYEEVAKEFHTNPQHVYELAHGLCNVTFDDIFIIRRLREKKIII